MGKKGSWFSAIKRVFSPNSSKDKQINEGSDKKKSKAKKGKGVVKNGESKSFIPLFREPSSIEKILGEADEHRLLVGEQPRFSSPKDHSYRAVPPKYPPPRVTSPSAAGPSKDTRQRKEAKYVHRPEVLKISAIRIQSAFRGYMARRSFRALRGLVRLQGVMRGNNVKNQTSNAMKQMQLMVRVQTQIHSRRIQMLENQSQAFKNDKDAQSSLSKWTQMSGAGNTENWDDSLLTKDEVEQRWRRKVEAVMKRERAMAYAYSHQLWKGHQRWSGYPLWWKWLDQPTGNHSANADLTPPRATSERKPPSPNMYRDEIGTPTSTKSAAVPMRSKKQLNTTPTRTPNSSLPRLFKYPLKDDDSLTSCPPFSLVPSYMAPTASAKAKAMMRASSSNPRERNNNHTGTPPSNIESKRRFSFPLTPNIRWNKDSATPEREIEKQGGGGEGGDGVSVHSSVSMSPAGAAMVGKRKPFNRFV